MIEVSRKGRMISSLPSFPPCLNDVKEDPSLSLAPPMGAQTLVEELDAGAKGFPQEPPSQGLGCAKRTNGR